jgi:sulfatase maturation enzyme AslB (radical SAM superfamily)
MLIKRIIKTILSWCGYKIIPIGNPENDAYYCRVLSGMSDYNLSINSDMSVSCKTSDFVGEAKIGNLDGINTLRSVFLGEKANAMRTMLANGKLPISLCSGCNDLCAVPKSVAEYYNKHIEMPTGGISVESCSDCNYNCIYCSRKELKTVRESNIISIDNMKYIANEIKDTKIKRIHYYKLGEPFFDKDIHKKLLLLREINPEAEIITSTNGSLIDNPEKVAAALLFDLIFFSIDGINTEMQNKYQRGANFEKTMENIKMIVKARGSLTKPILVWKYVVFSWNDNAEYINEVFEKAVEIGFDKLQFTRGSVAQYINNRSKRFYMKDFIPENIKYNLICYVPGHGMEFDLHRKNGA